MKTLAETLNPEVNFNIYVERMAGVRDKSKITTFINNTDKVLDYGCGNGVLALQFNPYFYIGYDSQTPMIREARKNHPGYYFTNNLAEADNIDVVIYSSVLHEIYSYNNNSLQKVAQTLKETAEILKPGGKILIRDGIMGEEYHNTHVTIKLVDANDATKFLTNLKTGPQDFSMIEIEGDQLTGTLEGVIHFLNVYTWGWKSIQREKQEKVNFLTPTGWHELFNTTDLQILHEEMIIQDSYFEHLSKLVDITTLPERWYTKALFVLQPNQV